MDIKTRTEEAQTNGKRQFRFPLIFTPPVSRPVASDTKGQPFHSSCSAILQQKGPNLCTKDLEREIRIDIRFRGAGCPYVRGGP
jgi:hypothetical protein